MTLGWKRTSLRDRLKYFPPFRLFLLLFLVKKLNAIQEENIFLSAKIYWCKKLWAAISSKTCGAFLMPKKSGRWMVFWHPALAVTKYRVAVPERMPPPESRLTQPSQQQSHESMRHTFNDRLLCLVTHIPSIPRLRWGFGSSPPPRQEDEEDWRDRDWNLLAMCLSESGSL